ncbi:MAG: Cof-type HAD-IIB family hydrolase [Clostridia bacterium]|nr:Cof-type HAD-IIB family hydrolase [Clostridia bacterium]
MKKFEGILFATDLDGTLLRKDKTISPENKEAISYFMEEGGIFTFITGRIPMGAAPILNQFTPNAPFGCINGGGIYDHRTEEMLWFLPLDKSVIELVKTVDESIPQMGIEVNLADKIYFCKKSRSTEKHRTDEKFPDLTCHYTEVTEPIAKILFAGDEEYMEPVANLLQSHPRANEFDFIRSDKEYYEILPKGATKGNLLLHLAELLHMDPARTIAAGDNDNDVSLLEMAGLGFAVSNASPAAKAAANHITVSNEEHAIRKIIEDLDAGIYQI